MLVDAGAIHVVAMSSRAQTYRVVLRHASPDGKPSEHVKVQGQSTWQVDGLAPPQLCDVGKGPVYVLQAEGWRLSCRCPCSAGVTHRDLPHALHRHRGVDRSLHGDATQLLDEVYQDFPCMKHAVCNAVKVPKRPCTCMPPRPSSSGSAPRCAMSAWLSSTASTLGACACNTMKLQHRSLPDDANAHAI